jgi:predicted acylesterase/phospholipase RssA
VSYSPHLRTAVLLSGNGTGGAYHAGVLRALHEAGIKIDVMSGRGVGVVCALFAAIDAGGKTWEDGGVWRRRPAPRIYQWRPPLQWAAVFALAAVAVLAIPLLVLATALVAYPLSFLVQMVSVDAGFRLAAAYADMVRYAFAPAVLPTIVPRLITLCLAIAFLVLAVSAIRLSAVARWTHPSFGETRRSRGDGGKADRRGHRDRGRWWARIIGAPWSPEPGLRHFRASLWQLFRGPTTVKEPTPSDLSRRYSELLFENLGQPGFRELIVTTLDMETRGDLVFAAIGDARRQAYFQRGRGDLIDLSGVGRSQVLDALAAAICLPVLTEPHVIAFSPESYWKGESHRTCDRIDAVPRLLEELTAAGVEQVIVVCPDSDRSGPHRLSKPSGSLRSRVAEQLAAAETTVIRDAVTAHKKRFKGLFLIQPIHNPIGPLDFEGTYDERSDRHQSLGELIDRGYEDAYRQFIEPVVGGAE